VRNYRDFLAVDDRFNHLHWLYQHNGGVFLPPWGKTEQRLISVQHTEDDIERFLENFERSPPPLVPPRVHNRQQEWLLIGTRAPGQGMAAMAFSFGLIGES
jgi:hypothetical protein